MSRAPAREVGDVFIRLVAGQSARQQLAFAIGTAAPLVAVGSRAGWAVFGHGIAPVHAVLAWSGRALFVCAQGDAAVCIDGAKVASRGWVPLPVGATLALGEARLTVGSRADLAPATMRRSEPTPRAPTPVADAVTRPYDEPPPSAPTRVADAATRPGGEPPMRADGGPLPGQTTLVM
ncbi:MAG TPA: hypothetical protein VM204_04035, partial [Gaiellaceae bacterium]|nr:hypothetical protein [Gaiellaceae bacterium]